MAGSQFSGTLYSRVPLPGISYASRTVHEKWNQDRISISFKHAWSDSVTPHFIAPVGMMSIFLLSSLES